MQHSKREDFGSFPTRRASRSTISEGKSPLLKMEKAMTEVSVLMVGLQPDLIDFSDPAYAAFPGMTAEKVMAGLNADQARLTSLGYDTSLSAHITNA